jgi:hypothetical protein
MLCIYCARKRAGGSTFASPFFFFTQSAQKNKSNNFLDICQLTYLITVIFLYPLVQVPVPVQLGKTAENYNRLGKFHQLSKATTNVFIKSKVNKKPKSQ